MIITKRFITGASFLAMLAIAACGLTAEQITQDVVTDAQVLGTGLAADSAAFSELGASPATVSTIQGDLADLNTEASALNTSLTTTAAQPIVTKIEGDLNAVVAATATISNLPTSLEMKLEAAEVLLPIIEVGVNLATPTAGAAMNQMTPAQALAILRAK
jgi:hypothetical protein